MRFVCWVGLKRGRQAGDVSNLAYTRINSCVSHCHRTFTLNVGGRKRETLKKGTGGVLEGVKLEHNPYIRGFRKVRLGGQKGGRWTALVKALGNLLGLTHSRNKLPYITKEGLKDV